MLLTIYVVRQFRKLIFSYWQAPIRWFEPEAYKAKLAAAGSVAILPINEAETDPE